MQPRALGRLLQMPVEERLDVVAEGLELLAEHAATLAHDVAVLTAAERSRGAAVLAAQADEEAAKALILLDLVRLGWDDEGLAARQGRRFYNHLARCIYADVAYMRPADFAELLAIVESMRVERYLDGPTDVDWIFRNQLLAQREERLYVDLVADEDGTRWVTPATNEEGRFGFLGAARDLVASLTRVGCTSREGLTLLSETWSGVVLEPRTHWQEARKLNERVVRALVTNDLCRPDATSEDASRVIDRWTFPLGGVDLELVEVSAEKLREERERRGWSVEV